MTDTTNVSANLDLLTAMEYVAAKEAADNAAKALAEVADRIKALGVGEVVLPDGTRVAVERRDRTAYDGGVLKRLLDKQTYRMVTQRSVVAAKVKEAVSLGLVSSEVAAEAAEVTEVEQVRVYRAK